MKKTRLFICLLVAVVMAVPSLANATLLAQKSFQTSGTGGSGGSGGSGTSSVDMTYQYFQSGDGWGWAGGAIAVNGAAMQHRSTGQINAANVTLRFNLGATVDALNTQYGAGAWTIANPVLTFSSSGAVQGNSRFVTGAGTFDIYWVGNDNWAQSKGTATDRQLNPVYAASAATLSTWAGTLGLLSSATYTLDSTGYFGVTQSLGLNSLFVNDVLTAQAASNPGLTLYLMSTSDELGMVIFNGGQGQALPTLSFDVVSAPVPIPAAVWMLGSGLAGLVGMRRRLFRK